jgi:predicted nucleic-acid-binding Zn-ribbon protein
MSEKILKCPKCGNKEIHCIAGAGEREINLVKKNEF